jgi:hypothetical protein
VYWLTAVLMFVADPGRLLPFFCTHCPCEPNATTMRNAPRAIVDLGKTPEINANPASAQRQRESRRAGLKIQTNHEHQLVG